MKKFLSFIEDQLTSPWWGNVVIWIIGNLFVWLIIPAYLSITRSGEVSNGMMTGDYAGVQALVSKVFNVGMGIFFTVSLGYNFMLRKRRGL